MKRYLIAEACEELGTEKEFLVHCIRARWISPADLSQELSFDDEDLARARLILELKGDFGVNDEAIPIILHLLDQVHYLRRKIRESSAA